jgi:hypothetical protein
MARSEAQKASIPLWNAKNPEKVKEYARAARARMMEKEPEVVAEWGRQAKARQYGRETCEILQLHEEELEDDTERLSTDFIRALVFGDEEECQE